LFIYHFHATVLCLYCCIVCIHIPKLGLVSSNNEKNNINKLPKKNYERKVVYVLKG
jgi:hypothetical protein